MINPKKPELILKVEKNTSVLHAQNEQNMLCNMVHLQKVRWNSDILSSKSVRSLKQYGRPFA